VHDTVMQSLVRFVQWSITTASLLGALVGVLLATWMSKPINLLCAEPRRIGEGHLDQRIELGREDELGALAGEFNQMAQKLAELDRMKQDFINSVTHDLRNPVAAVSGFAEILLSGKPGPVTEKQKECLNVMLSATATWRP